jgi:hypothetical protein
MMPHSIVAPFKREAVAKRMHPVGRHAIPPMAIPAGLTIFTGLADITDHGDPQIHMSVRFDCSFDGGLTWNSPEAAPFPISFGRFGTPTPLINDRTGVPMSEAFITCMLPHPSNPNRQIRGFLEVAGKPLVTTITVQGD